jgi:hypothetical protein
MRPHAREKAFFLLTNKIPTGKEFCECERQERNSKATMMCGEEAIDSGTKLS